MKSLKVFIICKETSQGEYTEPRYYASAKDATEILKVFFKKDKAKAELDHLNSKMQQEVMAVDEDDDSTDPVFFTMREFEVIE